MKKFISLAVVAFLLIATLATSASAAGTVYIADFEDEAKWAPYYDGESLVWAGTDGFDWVGLDTTVAKESDPLLVVTEDKAADGTKALAVKNNGVQGGVLKMAPIWYRSGKTAYPDNVIVTFKFFVPENSPLLWVQQKYVGTGGWPMDNNEKTVDWPINEEGIRGKWMDWSMTVGEDESFDWLLWQFDLGENKGNYGDVLFYIDSLQVVDRVTGNYYNEDGTVSDVKYVPATEDTDNGNGNSNNSGNTDDDKKPSTFDGGIVAYAIVGLVGLAGATISKRR